MSDICASCHIDEADELLYECEVCGQLECESCLCEEDE